MRVEALCPGCARERASTPAGLCERCTVEAARDRYVAEDNRLASLRCLDWQERTSGRDELATLRQQRHRLIERCRPRSPASAQDPLVIAQEALSRLRYIRRALGRTGATPPRSEDVAELEEAIRRLAWGPEIELVDGEVQYKQQREQRDDDRRDDDPGTSVHCSSWSLKTSSNLPKDRRGGASGLIRSGDASGFSGGGIEWRASLVASSSSSGIIPLLPN